MSRRERQARRQRHRGHPVKRVVVLSGVLGVVGVALAALFIVGWVVAVADSAPNLSELKPRMPHTLSQVYASDGTLLGDIHSDTIFEPVSPKQIPNRLKQATIAIEDRRFWQHGALDYQGILRAGVRDLFGSHRGVQGASTLTMQLIDNMYMPGDITAHHNLKYKITQAKLAQQLYRKHTRSWILNAYLNDVPYGTVGGETAQGVGAAAELFFDKPVWKLNLAEEALLAGLPQAPSEYNPFIAPHLALVRRAQVLDAMVKSHYIGQDQADAANRAPLNAHTNTSFDTHIEPFAFDYIRQELIRRFGLHTVQYGGLKVYTTIDLQKQQQARSAINSHEGGPVLDAQPAAALASVDPTNGHILALAQSAPYGSTPNHTTFDYATTAHRQPGSAFKIFALMTLIHDYNGDPSQTYYVSKFLPPGWNSADPTWSVHTAEQSYAGTINVAHATVVSDNTVFAQLASDLGYDKLDQTAHAMGITSPLNGFPSEVIGGLQYGVTPLEMADAYATLANGGVHHPTAILAKVVFPDGSVVNLGDQAGNRVFSYPETYAAIQIMKGVITSGTGTAADYGCPAAGKTGTANNMDNAWFVGFTPKYSTAVWVGYPQGNVPMPGGFGGTLAAPIWHDYMQTASGGFCGDWNLPANPWSGTAFFGPFATTGKAPVGPTGQSGTTTTTTTTSTNSYNNPTIYAHPPQPPGGTNTTGGAAPGTTTPTPPPGFGNGHNPSGNGNGNGNGNGKKTK